MITIESKELQGLRDALNTLYALRDHEDHMMNCHVKLGELNQSKGHAKRAERYQTIINQIIPAVKKMEKTNG